MKKLVAIILTPMLIMALIVPASAATTMKWDWGAARKSINSSITDLVHEEQTEPTEIPETEYAVAEETDAEVYTENEPEPVVEVKQERTQSWRDWLRRWSWCLEGWK